MTTEPSSTPPGIGTRSGVSQPLSSILGSPYAAIVGIPIAILFAAAVVVSMRTGSISRAELLGDRLHTWSGEFLARDEVLAFTVERHTPAHKDQLAVGWFVAARGRTGTVEVMVERPTEEHATYVCAEFAASLTRSRDAERR